MSDRQKGLLSAEAKHPVARGTYGFRPAVELRENSVPGELIEVTEGGDVVGHWRVDSNALVIAAMKGKTVIVQRGFPACARALREAGAEVTVYPYDSSAYNLAMSRHGGVTYL